MTRLTLVAAARSAGSSAPIFPADTDMAWRGAAVALPDSERNRPAVRGPEWRVASTASMLGVDAMAVDELRAWSAGDWTGRRIDEVAAEQPDDFTRWRSDPSFRPPGGESLDSLLDRVGRWLDSAPTGRDTGGRLLIIADTTVIAAALVHALGAGTETFWHLDVPPMSLSRVNRTGGTWRVRSLGITLASPH